MGSSKAAGFFEPRDSGPKPRETAHLLSSSAVSAQEVNCDLRKRAQGNFTAPIAAGNQVKG